MSRKHKPVPGHGPLEVRPSRYGADVIAPRIGEAPTHLCVAQFFDMDPWGGPTGMKLALNYVELLNTAEEVLFGWSEEEAEAAVLGDQYRALRRAVTKEGATR